MTSERNEALTDLIERVGGLTGASREVDGDIHNALFGTRYVRSIHSVTGFFTRVGDNGCPMVPAYTDSTDAALALAEKLLPGRSAYILREALNDLGKRFRWNIAFQQPGQMEQLPIAIVAALLRALSASKGDTV
jgi:hypothetical protein